MLKARVLLAEFIGTFALVFVGVLAVVHLHAEPTGLIGIALAHGITIACMVWATSALSGGHLNPAVSLALYIAQRISLFTMLEYIFAQMLGAIAAAFLLSATIPGEAAAALVTATPTLGSDVNAYAGIVFEAIATFFLLFVIFSTTLDRRSNRMAALFIGLTVTIGILAVGPYTGGALNPARYFGPAIAASKLQDWLVFVVGPILGAVSVAALFMTKTFHAEDSPEEAAELVTVEHVPSEPHAPEHLAEHHEHEAPAPLVQAEPVITSDPPRYLTSALYSADQPGTRPYTPSGPAAPSFTEPGISPDGRLNFSSIYRMGNLPDVPFAAEQVLDMASSLPAELPMEAKKVAISITLQTMAKTTGASVDTVLSDAARKMQALATFAENYTEQANQYILKTQHEIETMEAEIERRQRGIEEATNKQTQMVEACQAEADRIEKVFDYFEEGKSM